MHKQRTCNHEAYEVTTIEKNIHVVVHVGARLTRTILVRTIG